jgi:hypothetical protein
MGELPGSGKVNRYSAYVVFVAAVFTAAIDARADLYPSTLNAMTVSGVLGIGEELSADGFMTSPRTGRLTGGFAADGPAHVERASGGRADGLGASRSDRSLSPVGVLLDHAGWREPELYVHGAGSMAPDGGATPNEIRELPPLPGSATLYLSAVASIGGWYVLRSARGLHWHALPAWHQTNGALHVVDIDCAGWTDFSFGQSPCEFRPVVTDVCQLHFFIRAWRDSRIHADERCSLAVTAPRGPPTP